jgi:hypothetical protein
VVEVAVLTEFLAVVGGHHDQCAILSAPLPQLREQHPGSESTRPSARA